MLVAEKLNKAGVPLFESHAPPTALCRMLPVLPVVALPCSCLPAPLAPVHRQVLISSKILLPRCYGFLLQGV